jgi:esterase/lipase
LVAPYVDSRADASILDPAARAQSLGYGVTPTRLLPELAAVALRGWVAAPQVQSPTLMVQSRGDNRIRPEDAERAYERIGARSKELNWADDGAHVISVDLGREHVFAMTLLWLERFAVTGAGDSR